MDTVEPDSPEPSATAEVRAEPPPKRRWKVPTSIVVTFLGIALSAWLLPAFTRQWEDRQKARELQAAVADSIAVATAQLVATLDGVLGARDPLSERLSVSEVDPRKGDRLLAGAEDEWRVASLRIEARLRTYFGRSLVSEWSKFREASVAYLEAAYVHKFIQDASRDGVTADEQELLLDSEEEAKREYLQEMAAAAPCARALSEPGYGQSLGYVGEIMLGCASLLTDAVLASHPSGYSTTGRDLINDLVPF